MRRRLVERERRLHYDDEELKAHEARTEMLRASGSLLPPSIVISFLQADCEEKEAQLFPACASGLRVTISAR